METNNSSLIISIWLCFHLLVINYGDVSEHKCSIATKFRCSTGKCIPIAWRCDGEIDCQHGDDEDEKYCEKNVPTCNHDEMRCMNGICLVNKWICDGDNDCGDGSDEENCTVTCSPDQFRCNDMNCIDLTWRCDGDTDCEDMSDELDCQPTFTHLCKDTDWTCNDNKQCIIRQWKCDGTEDCSDGSDERNCSSYQQTTHPELILNSTIQAQIENVSVSASASETTTQQVTTVAGTERHDISCDSDSISIFIPTQLLLSSDQLAWRDPHCKATNNGSHFISTVSHTDCGTTVKFTKDEVIFQNALTVSHQTISRAASNGTIDFGGSNTPETIPVQCIYPRRQNISMAYRPAQSHVRFYEKRYGHMDVELEQFHSDKFTATYPARSYPLEVPINKDLYFRVHAMDSNSSDVALRVDKCVATPSVLPAYGKMYQLIDQGCPASPAVKMYPSSYDEVKFSVTAFEFSSSPGSVVYVHCQVSVCPAMDPKCLTGCIKRQRRDVSSPEDSSHLVSGGPYLLVAEEGSVSVPSVVAAVCACIAVVAAVFAVIGWRRKVRVSKLSSEQ